MGCNTDISLGNYFENFVDGRVSEGRFKNASEIHWIVISECFRYIPKVFENDLSRSDFWMI
jgi:Bacterial antitoxin of ParD toxin-antitoxin type II system and RHH